MKNLQRWGSTFTEVDCTENSVNPSSDNERIATTACTPSDNDISNVIINTYSCEENYSCRNVSKENNDFNENVADYDICSDNDNELISYNGNQSITDDESDVDDEFSGLMERLYENSVISVDESVLEILDLYVSNRWTKRRLTALLATLQKLLPSDNKMQKTIFRLFQYVEKFAAPNTVTKHLSCKHCRGYNGVDMKIANCLSCGSGRKDLSFFF